MKNFILDTNILLHVRNWWECFDDNTLIIPAPAIKELDKFKTGNELVNYNARETSRFLDSLPDDKLFDGGAPLGKGLIRIVGQKKYNDKVKVLYPEKNLADNQIINIVFELTSNELKDEETILVSMDTTLRLKAKTLKLKAENYKNNSVEDTKLFYEKTKEFCLSDKDLASLFTKKKIPVSNETESVLENEGVIFCQKDQVPTIARYRSGNYYLLEKEKISASHIRPKNPEQTIFMDALLDPRIQIVIAFGKAGTGKTLLALAAGIEELKSSNGIDKVCYTRKLIPLRGNNDIGFLPGDIGEKVNPFMMGMEDNLSVIGKKDKKWLDFISSSRKNGSIKIEPITFIRGRSIPSTFFIVDEGQNLTYDEIVSIATRLGEDSKLVILADIGQIDNPLLNSHNNGPVVFDSKLIGHDFYSRSVLLDSSVRSVLVEKLSKILL